MNFFIEYRDWKSFARLFKGFAFIDIAFFSILSLVLGDSAISEFFRDYLNFFGISFVLVKRFLAFQDFSIFVGFSRFFTRVHKVAAVICLSLKAVCI